MTQSKARERIQEIIEKFRREQAAGQINQYNESGPTRNFPAKATPLIYARHVLRNPRRNGKKPSLLTAFPGCTDMGTFPETTKG